MLTRLEVNGFKNLVDFSLDFGPFTCIFGPNEVGKSNILDAIRFLSLLTRFPINDSALRIRGGDADPDILWLLQQGGEDPARMSFAAEMLVGSTVTDDFGREGEPSSTFLRYELGFRYRTHAGPSGLPGGLELEHEALKPITAGRAAGHLKFPHSKVRFRDGVVYNRRHARTGYISTSPDDETGRNVIIVHQDSGAPGWGRPAPAENARQTIVGTENTIATPTILAARREMQSWLVLELNPQSLRQSDSYAQSPGVASDGAHIPATLRSLAQAGPESGEVSVPLSAQISELLPIQEIRLVADDVRQRLSLNIVASGGFEVPAGAAADSTLRLLALATLAASAAEGGLICIEQPETGIYPANLAAMNALLHQIPVNPSEEVGPGNPLGQVIMTTHSPLVVQLQRVEDLVWANSLNTESTPGEMDRRRLACVPHRGAWRCARDTAGFDLNSLKPFTTPRGHSQMAFPDEFWETGA